MASKSGGRRKHGRNKIKCQAYRAFDKWEENKKKRHVQLLKSLTRKVEHLTARNFDTQKISLHIARLRSRFKMK